MTPEQKEKLRADIHRVVSILPIETLALGYIRYEKLRLLNPREYSILTRKSLEERIHFDDLVDLASADEKTTPKETTL